MRNFYDIKKEVEQWWDHLYQELKYFGVNTKLAHAEQLASNIITKPDKLRLATPEVKGRLLYMLTYPDFVHEVYAQAKEDSELAIGREYLDPFDTASIVDQAHIQARNNAHYRLQSLERAILLILSYVQSMDEYNNVMQFMSLDISKGTVAEGEERLYNELGLYGFSSVQALQRFKQKLQASDAARAKANAEIHQAMAEWQQKLTNWDEHPDRLPKQLVKYVDSHILYLENSQFKSSLPIKPNPTVLQIIEETSWRTL